jgi:flagellar M-ring protein FliF
MMSRAASTPNMSLLYAGLESSSAGEVVATLEQRGVRYEVRGDTIFVETSQRDQLRMTLASAGLPTNSGQGYELLDSLSGFGTTSQMFDAAYWRAKEGELARTIITSPLIRSARVHISNPSARPFQRDVNPTAAVTVSTGGGALSQPQAKALKYLVASAVSGLSPDDVAIIDDQGGLISGADDTGFQRNTEDRAAEMRQRVERLLEARVGYGNAVVEVSVETTTETEQIIERIVDPDSRIAISTEIEETSNSSNATDPGNVSIASNLPEGDGAGGGASANENTETRERINYEMSETQREITRGPGEIKRLSVAVLVNGVVTVDDAGVETTTARDEEEMAALEALVASAVGFDAARGDVITLRTMTFDPIAPLGTDAAPAPTLMERLDIMTLIQVAVLSLVALILGLFVVRPILASSKQRLPELAAPEGTTPSPVAVRADGTPVAGNVLQGEIDVSGAELNNLTVVSNGATPQAAAGQILPNGQVATSEEAEVIDPVTRLRQMIEERQDETVQILRDWIETPDQKERA